MSAPTAATQTRYAVRELPADYWRLTRGRSGHVTYAVVDLATSTAHKGGNSWSIEATRDTRADADALAASLNGGAA